MAKKRAAIKDPEEVVPEEVVQASEESVLELEGQIKSLDKPQNAFGGDLSALSPTQIEEVVRVLKGNSPEAVQLRRQRKEVRYNLYRLRTEAEGKCSAHHITSEFRKVFESQPEFKGWRFFGSLWDVTLLDPYVIVARDHTELEEWEAIIQAKFPQLTASGGVVYPDLVVKERVAEVAAELAETDTETPSDTETP